VSDTPETDEAWGRWPYAGPGVHANFARRLERERNEAREENARLREWHGLTDAELRLRLGELTAQEIRTVRAVLNAILADETTN
jgi:hypothetical protein